MASLRVWPLAGTGRHPSPAEWSCAAETGAEVICPLWFRYPGSVFTDHVLRYQDTPGVEMIVVLGEVSNRQHADPCCFSLPDTHSVWVQIGGTEEYKICEAIQRGRITKPVVCWCIGTCATMFSSEVRGQGYSLFTIPSKVNHRHLLDRFSS